MDADHPAVTVVIPTHRRPGPLLAAVRSVVAQDYPGAIHIVVVFDACEQELAPVELPATRTLTLVENTRTRGLAGARNTGIELARDDFVAFLDDDDTWLPHKLSAQVHRFGDRPDAILVGGAIVVDDGTRRHERLVPVDPVTHGDLLRDRMAGLHSSTFVFRREGLLDRVGLVDEQLPNSYGEDYDLLLRTAQASDIHVVNEPVAVVAWQGQSYFFGKWNVYADALEYLLAQHPEFEREPRAVARIASQVAFSRAAGGRSRDALRWAVRSLRRDPRQIKAYLAVGIALHVLSADWVIRTVQRRGKGI